jgi:trk system potassium uptake protein TrkH
VTIDLRPVFFIIGVMLTVVACAMALPLLADLAERNPDWQVFLAAALVTLFVGVALAFACRSGGTRLQLRQAFLVTSMSWVIICGFAALPFAFASLGLSYTDAFFEAMSGLTTTGSTVIVGLDAAPPGILLWRGLLQWLGGIGIIATAIAILPMLRVGGMQLFRLESSDRSDKVVPRAPQLATNIAAIYFILSSLCALGYWLGGMSGFDAVIHSMTTIATGGHSTSDNSFANWNSPFVDAVAIVFMLLGGMTFTLFLRGARGDWRSIASDGQIRLYLGLAAAFTLAIALWQWRMNGVDFAPALRHAAFNVVSIMTTTGYASADYYQWGPFPVMLFFLLTFVGGCSGSTAGGIKIFRFMILFEVGRSHVRHTLIPSGMFVPKFNRKQITEAVTQSVLAFVFLYVAIVVTIAAGLALVGLDLVTSLTGAATAVGNVGPGLGEIIGPAGNFSSLPDAAKWLLSIGMLLGRLEILTVLVLFSRTFWRP